MSAALELGDIQGLVARAYSNLRAATFLLFEITDPKAAGSWLAMLAETVTSAAASPGQSALNVALTVSGVSRLGLDAAGVAAFSFEFQEGMASPTRSRLLGDVEESAPENWIWGGPGGRSIDVLVLVYGVDEATVSRASVALAPQGVQLAAQLGTADLGDKEHFGFHDGISQPIVEGLSKATGAQQVVRAGEFILGYPNEYGLLTERPVLESGFDLGRNGTYLVFRQLSQDVEGFWRFVEEAARAWGEDSQGRTRMAARLVGRWPGGAPLVLSPEKDDPALATANDFGYFQPDPDGLRCPLGAHVRRSNPRDSLDPRPGSAASLAINQRHRILRRGREYGRPDAQDKGLHFICLSANLMRQFEFVQHTWLVNPNFHGLHEDTDPLVAPHTTGGNVFTIPAAPVRRRLKGLPRFVTVRGGAYFFLPGLRALRYLSGLAGASLQTQSQPPGCSPAAAGEV